MSSDDGYEVRLRCTCGEHAFRVRYRHKREDIAAWIEGVVRPGMAAAHAQISPLCLAQAADLMLPISEAADGVGMRVEH